MAAAPITRTCSLGALALLAAAPAYAQADTSAYVRARAADAAGLSQVASAGYAQALAAQPDDAVIAMHAYRQAVEAGDYNLASRAAAVLVRAGTGPADTAILAYAIALNNRDATGAKAALDRLAAGPLAFLAPVLRAWAAVDRGENPMPYLDAARGDAIGARFAIYHRPLVMIAMGRPGDAGIALEAMLGFGNEEPDLRIETATLLAGAGQREQALALIAGDRPEYTALRKRLGKGAKGNSAFGASRLFLRLARELSDPALVPLQIMLTRSALLLDPSDDRTRLTLADALSRNGAATLAMAELAKITADSPWHRAALAGQVTALRRAGRAPEAIAQAKALAADDRATSSDARAYGDVLAADSQFAAAAAAYTDALKRAGAEGDWELHYLLGSALDQAGRWAEALPALRRAVELGPDQADALEYLGRAQVAHGENLPQAVALLERARKLKPDDAAIADSLAWAYYRQGDVARALPLLEQAARGDPGGTQVNEHLGDVYWRLGRYYEARYAWRAAAIYADNDSARRLEGKLVTGLN